MQVEFHQTTTLGIERCGQENGIATIAGAIKYPISITIYF
jgi:hypothetical protein